MVVESGIGRTQVVTLKLHHNITHGVRSEAIKWTNASQNLHFRRVAASPALAPARLSTRACDGFASSRHRHPNAPPRHRTSGAAPWSLASCCTSRAAQPRVQPSGRDRRRHASCPRRSTSKSSAPFRGRRRFVASSMPPPHLTTCSVIVPAQGAPWCVSDRGCGRKRHR